jgi:hypothetical protein
VLEDAVRLHWSHPSEGVFFNIYKRKEGGAYSLNPMNPEPLKELSFRDAINVNETVYYTIRALRGGSIRDEGPPSGEAAIGPGDYVPSQPTGLHAVLIEDRVVLLWEENPEEWVRGYVVYREGEGGESLVIGTAQTPTFTDREASKGRVLYRIRAVGPVREGVPSEPLEVITR